MMKGYFVFVLIVSTFSFGAIGKVIELKKDTRSIFIEQKKDWKLSKELFGMPFIYFSPQVNGQRSNISFTDTDANLELDIKSLAKAQNTFQDGRKKWANQVGATPQSFSPYEVMINKHGHKVHKIGFSYEHQTKVYQEKSYYIECRGKILFAKSLRTSENAKHDKDFGDLITSLDCGGV